MSTAQRLTMTVVEAAEKLGIGRSQAYEAARKGEIPTIRIGGRILIPRAAFERMLEVGEPAAENPTEAGGLVGSGSAKS